MKYLILFLFFSSQVEAATCKKLNECVELNEKLTGEKIIFDKKLVPFTYELNKPIEINKSNADKTLSEALVIFGLTKIPTDIKNTSKIVQARDIRFETDLPSYTATRNKMPKLPDSKMPVKVTYQGVKGVDMEIIAQKVEPLLSRYGRVAPMRDGSIIVIDLANQVSKILPEIKKQDFPLTPDEKEKLALEKKREHELELARLKSSELHEIGPHKHGGHEEH